MIPGYAGCEKCPLRDCPPVYGFGPHGKMAIVGEAPGANEVRLGRPFVGKSGTLLRQTLFSLGIDSDSVYMTNAVMCRPNDNDTPTWAAIQACHDRLVAELDVVAPTKVLSVGAIGLSAVLNQKSVAITKIRGIGMMVDNRYFVPTYHPSAVLRDPDTYRDFANDVSKWLSNSAPLDTRRPIVIIPQDAEEASTLLRELRAGSIVSCDLETTGFDFMKDEILSIGFGVLLEPEEGRPDGLSIIIPKRIADQCRDDILHFVGGAFDRPMIFHNGKFDMQFLMRWADDVNLWPHEFRDTMLMQYSVDERGTGSGGRQYKTLGLKDQARIRYDIPDYHFDFEKFLALSEEERPYDELYTYQGLDCYIALRLHNDLLDEIVEESELLWTGACQTMLFPGAHFLARMEYRGFPVDVEYFRELNDNLLSELGAIEVRLAEICKASGIEPATNWKSSVQIRKLWEALGVHIETGAEREVIMLEMRKDGYSALAKEFVLLTLDYRQKAALRQNYVEGVLKRLGDDNRIRPDFALQGADTSRLSCRDPNLQNIPTLVGPMIRRGYVAPPGWVLAEIDYSQLELRVVAFYSRDAAMMQAFIDKRDIHRIVAGNMFKKPEAEVTKLERYMAKYVDFGIIYGRSAMSLASGWEMEYVVEQGGEPWTVKEAQKFLDEFLNGMPGLRDWITNQHKLVKQTHYTETPIGRRRRFPLITWESQGAIERKAVNTPVQSFASDICLYNGITLDQALDDSEAYLVSTVHDALYFIIREDRALDLVPQIIHTMETNTPTPFDVPLVVDAKVGTRWGELEDFEEWRTQQATKPMTQPGG